VGLHERSDDGVVAVALMMEWWASCEPSSVTLSMRSRAHVVRPTPPAAPASTFPATTPTARGPPPDLPSPAEAGFAKAGGSGPQGSRREWPRRCPAPEA
jgi:hypothetical protein